MNVQTWERFEWLEKYRILLWIITINKDKQWQIHIDGFIVCAHNFMFRMKQRENCSSVHNRNWDRVELEIELESESMSSRVKSSHCIACAQTEWQSIYEIRVLCHNCTHESCRNENASIDHQHGLSRQIILLAQRLNKANQRRTVCM